MPNLSPSSASPLILLSLPGLRARDLSMMPNLVAATAAGTSLGLVPGFPAVTWPVQTNMLTGKLPAEHGIVANGIYQRSNHKVTMWTSACDIIMSPLIWDTLRNRLPTCRSAVWFPMLSKGSQADFVCMPAPVHNPDGSESLWCYTRPSELYGELLQGQGHFPLQHFWGPLAGIQSSRWIAESAVHVAHKYRPQFFYIYLPHLDYAAQKSGPDSPAATEALTQLDEVIADLVGGMQDAYRGTLSPTWMAASEYAINDVSHVVFPNRVLRDAGLLRVREENDGEYLDFAESLAWAMTDHQFSHVFVRDGNQDICRKVVELFEGAAGISEVLDSAGQREYGIAHPRCGDVVLVSSRESWQAYYWWNDDDRAPGFARTVDIHRKPGYDPVELYFDPVRRAIPLDATLVRGSHGAPARAPDQQGVLLCSAPLPAWTESVRDIDIHTMILQHFLGAEMG
jgi:Type I phosphodiesterase / nucleotide pyrophosphatase